jgi:hypothetical protein
MKKDEYSKEMDMGGSFGDDIAELLIVSERIKKNNAIKVYQPAEVELPEATTPENNNPSFKILYWAILILLAEFALALVNMMI